MCNKVTICYSLCCIDYALLKFWVMSMGIGNTIVEFFSAAMWLSVWRYLEIIGKHPIPSILWPIPYGAYDMGKLT